MQLHFNQLRMAFFSTLNCKSKLLSNAKTTEIRENQFQGAQIKINGGVGSEIPRLFPEKLNVKY